MELNDNELWYVRAAIRRGVASVEDVIKDGEEYLEGEGIPGTLIEATRNMVAYHEQLLSEMRQYIPDSLLE